MDRATLPGDPPVEITLRQAKTARRISLRVSALDGRVTLSMPRGYPKADALAFAEQKADWIRRHLAAQSAPISIRAGADMLYRGQSMRIATGATARVYVDGKTLIVPKGEAMVAARVRAFLKLHAKAQLVERAEFYADRLGRKIGRITLRDTRSRWGSCTATGNLMFSWRLIMAPPDVLDYVAAHEVAHLVELNHSRAYWAVVESIFPDYARQRAWLRQHGTSLHRFRFED